MKQTNCIAIPTRKRKYCLNLGKGVKKKGRENKNGQRGAKIRQRFMLHWDTLQPQSMPLEPGHYEVTRHGQSQLQQSVM